MTERDSCCSTYDREFDQGYVEGKLRDYRRRGPDPTTRDLVEFLSEGGVEGLTILDVGGGAGVVHHELIARGASRAVEVDIAAASISVARSEAERRGHADRVIYHAGDFVDLAPQIEPADIVALDRVVCCYRDVDALVGLSADRARLRYGLVYPRDTWWMRAAERILNLPTMILRNRFRFYVHRRTSVESLLVERGFRLRAARQTLVWRIALFERVSQAS